MVITIIWYYSLIIEIYWGGGGEGGRVCGGKDLPRYYQLPTRRAIILRYSFTKHSPNPFAVSVKPYKY